MHLTFDQGHPSSCRCSGALSTVAAKQGLSSITVRGLLIPSGNTRVAFLWGRTDGLLFITANLTLVLLFQFGPALENGAAGGKGVTPPQASFWRSWASKRLPRFVPD